MPQTVLWGVMAGYLLSFAFLLRYSRGLRPETLRLAKWALGLTVFFHLLFVASWWLARDLAVMGDSFYRQAAFAVTGFVFYLLSYRRSRLLIVLIGLPAMCLGMLIGSFIFGGRPLTNLPSIWLWVHIALMLMGEMVFFVAALVSGVYLVADWQLRRRDATSFFAKVPSLPLFDEILGKLLPLGFSFLTIGMIMGIFFARSYWGEAWYLDPKVVLSGLSWLVYAFLVVMRFLNPRFHGRPSAVLAVLGFLLVIFLSWGVQSLMPTRHLGAAQETGQAE